MGLETLRPICDAPAAGLEAGHSDALRTSGGERAARGGSPSATPTCSRPADARSNKRLDVTRVAC